MAGLVRQPGEGWHFVWRGRGGACCGSPLFLPPPAVSPGFLWTYQNTDKQTLSFWNAGSGDQATGRGVRGDMATWSRREDKWHSVVAHTRARTHTLSLSFPPSNKYTHILYILTNTHIANMAWGYLWPFRHLSVYDWCAGLDEVHVVPPILSTQVLPLTQGLIVDGQMPNST